MTPIFAIALVQLAVSTLILVVNAGQLAEMRRRNQHEGKELR